MKQRTIIFLLIISFSSCYGQVKKDDQESQNNECSGAKPDKYLVMLEKYNNDKHPNYTGKVIDKQDYDGIIVNGETFYQNGKITLRNTFFENGQIRSSTPIKCCSIHGILKMYYSTGKLQYSAEFYLGVFEGKVIAYYPNGNPKTIKTYSKGVEISIENYDQNGIKLASHQ